MTSCVKVLTHDGIFCLASMERRLCKTGCSPTSFGSHVQGKPKVGFLVLAGSIEFGLHSIWLNSPLYFWWIIDGKQGQNSLCHSMHCPACKLRHASERTTKHAVAYSITWNNKLTTKFHLIVSPSHFPLSLFHPLYCDRTHLQYSLPEFQLYF